MEAMCICFLYVYFIHEQPQSERKIHLLASVKFWMFSQTLHHETSMSWSWTCDFITMIWWSAHKWRSPISRTPRNSLCAKIFIKYRRRTNHLTQLFTILFEHIPLQYNRLLNCDWMFSAMLTCHNICWLPWEQDITFTRNCACLCTALKTDVNLTADVHFLNLLLVAEVCTSARDKREDSDSLNWMSYDVHSSQVTHAEYTTVSNTANSCHAP